MNYLSPHVATISKLLIAMNLLIFPVQEIYANSAANKPTSFVSYLQKNNKAIHDFLTKHKQPPTNLKNYIDKEFHNLKGTIEIRAALYSKKPGEAIQYLLKTNDGKLYYLHIVGDHKSQLKTGDEVILKHTYSLKTQNDYEELIVAAEELTITKTATALPDAFGPRRTIAFLVNFQNQPTNQPWTPTQVSDTLFNNVNSFYYEASYNQTNVVGNVIGWYTLTLNSTADCNTLTNNIPTLAAQEAARRGVDLSSYTHRIYFFPNTASCSWAGLGTVGRGGAYSQAWINGYNDLRVVAHELGHNIGLWHSNRLQCSGGSCSHVEYGDYSDTMGSGPGTHFNAYQKERLGWLNYNVSPTIQTVTATGNYSIAPYEVRGNTPDTNTKGIKILKATLANGSQDYYYLEYRQPIGYDTPLGTCGTSCDFTRGVLIHTGNSTNGNSSYILDPTPDSTNPRLIALLPGQSFSDPSAPNGGVTITTNSVSTTGANVTVRFGSAPPPCVRAATTMTITPNSILTVRPGESRDYSVTVTNNDSIGCATSQYLLFTATTSPLMTARLNTSTILLKPGQTTTMPLRVSMATNAYAHTYYFGVLANNVTIPGNNNYTLVTGGMTVVTTQH